MPNELIPNTISFPFDGERMGLYPDGFPKSDRDFYARHWAEYFASVVGNGVFPKPEIGLTVRAGDGMTVLVDKGRAWINGYYHHNYQTKELTVDPADELPRIDRIVARWGIVRREIYLYVLKGEPSETPTPPELVRDEYIYDLCLAEMTLPANATETAQIDIRDTRLESDLCGLVVAAIQNVDFTTFSLQFHAWFEYIQGLLSGDALTSLANEVIAIWEQLSFVHRNALNMSTFQNMIINGNMPR